MKKIIYSLFACAVTMSSVACMEVDNWDAPEARFSGKIIDSTTDKPILASQGEYQVRLYEMSFSADPDPFDIPVKQDGTFNNHRLFPGTYDVVLEGAWWPIDRFTGIGISNKGTSKDFEVIPYYTISDFETSLDTTDPENPKLTMSCRVFAPVAETVPDIFEMRPLLSLTNFCGFNQQIGGIYSSNNYRIMNMKSWNSLVKDADGKSEVQSVTVPVKAGYIYFVRIGLQVNSTPRYSNYSEIIKVEVEVPQ